MGKSDSVTSLVCGCGCGKDGPGGNKRVPNEGVQGYLNWSTFEARKARFKASYESRL